MLACSPSSQNEKKFFVVIFVLFFFYFKTNNGKKFTQKKFFYVAEVYIHVLICIVAWRLPQLEKIFKFHCEGKKRVHTIKDLFLVPSK